MGTDYGEFERTVAVIAARYFAQNGRPAPPAAVRQEFAARLAALVAERGLPPPLAPGACGTPGGMAESECAVLVARVMGGGAAAARPAGHAGGTAGGGGEAGAETALLAELARQLVKTCFYPEFTVCRDSFREVGRDGVCRRQELGRVRTRASGTHCVDCPYWTALAPDEHAAMLAGAWHGPAAEFAAARVIFLPEDFRALRRWRHAAARNPA
jgi:hypothetical protein